MKGPAGAASSKATARAERRRRLESELRANLRKRKARSKEAGPSRPGGTGRGAKGDGNQNGAQALENE